MHGREDFTLAFPAGAGTAADDLARLAELPGAGAGG